MTTDPFANALERLKRRVDETVAQCERFDLLTDEVREWARFWTVTSIRRWMESKERSVAELERALVALALSPTEQAGHILEEYDPDGQGETHRLFHQIARLEWERRALPWEDPWDHRAA